MAEHTVFGVKIAKEITGGTRPRSILSSVRRCMTMVSLEAWKGWTEFCKMLLNEYRIKPRPRERVQGRDS